MAGSLCWPDLHSVPEHDVLVLAMVRLLLPDVDLLLDDALSRVEPPAPALAPVLAVLLHVRAERQPGTQNRAQQAACA